MQPHIHMKMISLDKIWSVTFVLYTMVSQGHALTATRFREKGATRTTGSAKLKSDTRFQRPGYSGLLSSQLGARYRRSYSDDEEEYDEISRQRATDRPTQTVLDIMGPPLVPAKPKIVVLGATGRIGRMVVKQLLEMRSVDMTVVALVRDYDKAVRVLYDDMAVPRSSKGPKLQIVQGDLVPQEELPFFVEDDEEEREWREKAGSAAKFYGTDENEYDNREELPDINETLELAIKDSTTIISCVGSVRPTNLWTDVLERPFLRLLKADVSKWCADGRHPYYVHYASTRKALGYAEREQLRREAAAETMAEDMAIDEIRIPRIRFIRVSDLCVGQKPWDVVPLITNAARSVVFRYQEMAEQLLDQSTLVETVVLRPGDLVDDERDANATSVQVCSSGTVPQPARIGREDVASLAVASAMFATKNKTDSQTNEPFHYTLACRWVGEELDPYPAQGKKTDGKLDAQSALQATLKKIYRQEKRSRERRKKLTSKRKRLLDYYDEEDTPEIILRLARQLQRQRQKPKPHGLFAAIPIYFFVVLALKSAVVPMLHVIPGGKTLILPAMQQLNQRLTLTLSLLFRRIMMMLPWIVRRPKKYILL